VGSYLLAPLVPRRKPLLPRIPPGQKSVQSSKSSYFPRWTINYLIFVYISLPVCTIQCIDIVRALRCIGICLVNDGTCYTRV